MPFLSVVTSTETFGSAVLYENKGLFLGGKISYYMRPTVDGKPPKEVEFALKMSLSCLSLSVFYTIAISATARSTRTLCLTCFLDLY